MDFSQSLEFLKESTVSANSDFLKQEIMQIQAKQSAIKVNLYPIAIEY